MNNNLFYGGLALIYLAYWFGEEAHKGDLMKDLIHLVKHLDVFFTDEDREEMVSGKQSMTNFLN